MFYQFENEHRIVWLVPQSDLPRYVRESIWQSPWRVKTARLPFHNITHSSKAVAYVELKPCAEGRGWRGFQFVRRFWWLTKDDPYPGGGHPCEAVATASIKARKPSKSLFDKEVSGYDATF